MNLSIIEEIYDSYVRYRNDAYDLIHQNDERIEEIDVFLNSIDTESDSYKFFSPFSSDVLYDGKVNLLKDEKEALLLSNENNYLLIKEYNDKISRLDDLFKDINDLENLNDEKDRYVSHSDSVDILDVDSLNISSEYISSHLASSEIKEPNAFILEIQESERKRLADDLHDIFVQDLVHVVHSIELSSLFIDQDPIRAKLELESCIHNLRKSIDDIRNTIFNLRPMSFNDLSFKEFIFDYIDKLHSLYSNVYFDLDIDEFDLSSKYALMVFRIIQECIVNSLKHSHTDRIVLHVKHINDNIDIYFQDFGVGFDVSSEKDNHYGLTILKDRVFLFNGSIDINSVINEGTTFKIVLPVI